MWLFKTVYNKIQEKKHRTLVETSWVKIYRYRSNADEPEAVKSEESVKESGKRSDVNRNIKDVKGGKQTTCRNKSWMEIKGPIERLVLLIWLKRLECHGMINTFPEKVPIFPGQLKSEISVLWLSHQVN